MKEILIGGGAYVVLVAGILFLNYRFWNNVCPWAEYELEQRQEEETENGNQ